MLVPSPLRWRRTLIPVCLWIKAPQHFPEATPLRQPLMMPVQPSETHAGFWDATSSPCARGTGTGTAAAASPARADAAPAPLTGPTDAAPVHTLPHGSRASSGPAHLSAPQLWLLWGDRSLCPPGTTSLALPKKRAQRGLLPGCSAVPFPGGCPSTWGALPLLGLAAPAAGARAVCLLDHAVPRCRLARPALCLDTGSSPDNTLPHIVNILPKQCASLPQHIAPQGWHREGAAA